MSKMDLKNARNPEQIRRMQALKAAGLCYFCREGNEEKVTTPKVVFEGEHWYITPNNFAYKGTVHHFIVAPKRHILKLSSLKPEESVEFFSEMIPWVENKFGKNGYSMFVRAGNTKYTSATIDHLHFQVLIGGPKPKKFTLTKAVPTILAFKKKKK